MQENKVVKSMISAVLLCLLSTACSEQGVQIESEEASREKNSVVIALSGEPEEGFDPCLGWGRFGNPLIQSRLFYFDENLDLEYDLATHYEVSEDGLVWTFHLREDVFFTDGEALTSEDVAFTFETAQNKGANFDLTVLEKVEILGDFQLAFHLKHPQFAFLYTVAQTGIVPQHAYDENYSNQPMGSGAFVFRQWDKGQQVILTANEDYYGEVPTMEQVTLLFMSNTSALTAAKQGVVDVAITDAMLLSQQGLGESAVKGMTLQAFASIDNRGISLPVDESSNLVTSDIAIRRALSYGIDREQLVEDCLNGYGTPAFTECDGMPWSNQTVAVDFDREKAISFLEEGGWLLNDAGIREKQGVTAEFTLLYSASDAVRQSLSFAVAQQGKELGILIHTEGTNWTDIQNRMNTTPVLLGFGAENPMETYLLYHSSNAKQDYYNTENYQNPVVDQYLDLAMSQRTLEDAFQYFQAVQWDGETGVSALGDIPFLWLVNLEHLYYIADGLSVGEQKIHPHGHDFPILSNLQQWEWENS